MLSLPPPIQQQTEQNKNEKLNSYSSFQVEDGREAEASIHPYTRSRSRTPKVYGPIQVSGRGRGRGRASSVERPSPIVWQNGRITSFISLSSFA